MEHVKCVVVGDGAIGKTAMLMRYQTDTFVEYYIPTVFENYHKNVIVNDQPVVLELWDTAGQEDYDKLRPLSYHQTDVFLVCFAIDSRSSFQNTKEKWVPEIQHFSKDSRIILVATKIDLRNTAHKMLVTHSEGIQLMKEIKANNYLECSALSHNGIKNVFEEAAKLGLAKKSISSNRRKCCSFL